MVLTRLPAALVAGALLTATSMALPAGTSPSTPLLEPRQSATFTNPILWEDLPDIDVFRVGDVFYKTTSTFAFSPGAPVHKSYDLANWTPVSHSVPRLDFGNEYNLNGAGSRAYVKGIWASSMRYRASNDMFYWMGCIQSTGKTYVYTSAGSRAKDNNGEAQSWNWKQSSVINKCYYDNGILVDDNDTMYVVYGNRKLTVAQLSADGLSEVRSQQVYDSGDIYLEGAHMYKIKGFYWIVPTKVASGEYVLRSRSPFGPYEARVLFDNVPGPLSNAGWAHQGGMVDTKDGNWHYIAFLDAYPGGRIPVMAPLTWTSDNWPQLVKDSQGRWSSSYPMPVRTSKTVPGPRGVDLFTGSALGPRWEWNHNPDASKFRLAGGSGGLVLQTATVTDDLFNARNTLTHRITGPRTTATLQLDISQMRDGDRAGLAMFRDKAGYIGVHRANGNAQLVRLNGVNLGSGWVTESKGSVVATGPNVTGGKVWLRVDADITPAFGLQPVRQANFSYSTDGNTFTNLGPSFTMINEWNFFTGYRFGVFNFATQALGGQVTVKGFANDGSTPKNG
ncbi:hypothetical protein MCOR24_007887 [Pyricularia oryzae]|nr:hypothetical protein MCOR24_007887 [Pyricularia oryzae]